MNAQVRPFPIDAKMTAIAIGFKNPAHTLIGKSVMPGINVTSEAFKWKSFPLAERFTLPDTEVGRKGSVPEIEFTANQETGNTTDHGLDSVVPNSDMDEYQAQKSMGNSVINPLHLATQGLTDVLDLRQEVDISVVVQDINNYDPDKRLIMTNGNQLSDAGTDTLALLYQAIEGPFLYRANSLSFGHQVWKYLRKDPQLVEAFKGQTDKGMLTKAQFAELLEMQPDQIHIGTGWLNTSKPGQSPVLKRVWGNSIQAHYIDPIKESVNDDFRPTWGFEATLNDKIAGSINEPKTGLKGSQRVRVGAQRKPCVCAKALGYIISNAVPAEV